MVLAGVYAKWLRFCCYIFHQSQPCPLRYGHPSSFAAFLLLLARVVGADFPLERLGAAVDFKITHGRASPMASVESLHGFFGLLVSRPYYLFLVVGFETRRLYSAVIPRSRPDSGHPHIPLD